MAVNFPGPYEVLIPYTTVIGGIAIPHELKVNCVAIGSPPPGTPTGGIQLQTISGSPVNLQVCVDGLWNMVRVLFSNTTLATQYELYRYPTAGSYAKDFIASGLLTNANGSAVAGSTAAWQATLTFRSANGGTMRIQLMESVHAQKTLVPLTANASGDNNQKLAAYVISSAGWMLARDDSFPTSPKSLGQTENEALNAIRFR